MHRCLDIAEIIGLICEQGFHDKDVECRKGVMALALTCRSMYEPAANVIWYRVPSLLPLLGTIPEDVWNGIKDPNPNTLRPLRPSDLLRLRELAKRVRAFGIDLEKYENMDPGTCVGFSGGPEPYQYKALNIAIGHAPLLPNIHEVTLANVDLTTFSYINLITNPHIKTIRVLIPVIGRPKSYLLGVSGFLDSWRNRYPELERVDIRTDNFQMDTPIAITIEDALKSCRWQNLSKIVLHGGVSAPMLLDIFQRSSLKTIQIQTPQLERRLPPVELGQVSGPVVPLLQDIFLFVNDLPLLLDFLRLLVPGKRDIQSATLWADNPRKSTSEHWSKVLEYLHASCRPLKLDVLSLDDRAISSNLEIVDEIARDTSYTISFDHLKWLFSFKSLTNISISTFGVLVLDDSVVDKIIQCWPQIQELQLQGQHPLNHPPKVTLSGLALFAEKCSDLKKLAIEVKSDANLVSNPSSKPRFGRLLKKLELMQSPIDEPGTIAAFLADIFPNMEDLEWESQSDESDDLWKQAKRLHPIFVKARSDEASRLKSSHAPAH